MLCQTVCFAGHQSKMARRTRPGPKVTPLRVLLAWPLLGAAITAAKPPDGREEVERSVKRSCAKREQLGCSSRFLQLMEPTELQLALLSPARLPRGNAGPERLIPAVKSWSGVPGVMAGQHSRCVQAVGFAANLVCRVRL